MSGLGVTAEDPYVALAEGLFEPEGIDPVIHFDRLNERNPEKALRIAVLEDVIVTFRRVAQGMGPSRHYDNQKLKDSIAWVTADDYAWPYSFVNLCEALSLSPSAVRTALFRLLHDPKEQRIRRYRRARGNSRLGA